LSYASCPRDKQLARLSGPVKPRHPLPATVWYPQAAKQGLYPLSLPEGKPFFTTSRFFPVSCRSPDRRPPPGPTRTLSSRAGNRMVPQSGTGPATSNPPSPS